MKKSKITLITLLVIIILSIIAVILLEYQCFQALRDTIAIAIPFLDERKALLSNIFLGIFASAFCMFLGEFVAIICLEYSLKNEIRKIFNELWIKMNFKNGSLRKDYIDNALVFVQYSDKIENLYREFENKRTIEYFIIHLLNYMLFVYKCINETEYMRASNNVLFERYVDVLHKSFSKDLKIFYYMSEYDEEIMLMRKDFEKRLTDCTNYNFDTDKRIDEYIIEIKKIEEKLNSIYDVLSANKKFKSFLQ